MAAAWSGWGGADPGGSGAGRQPKVGKDRAHNTGVLHGGDATQATATARAGQQVEGERPVHQRRPGPVAWGALAPVAARQHDRSRLGRQAGSAHEPEQPALPGRRRRTREADATPRHVHAPARLATPTTRAIWTPTRSVRIPARGAAAATVSRYTENALPSSTRERPRSTAINGARAGNV